MFHFSLFSNSRWIAHLYLLPSHPGSPSTLHPTWPPSERSTPPVPSPPQPSHHRPRTWSPRRSSSPRTPQTSRACHLSLITMEKTGKMRRWKRERWRRGRMREGWLLRLPTSWRSLRLKLLWWDLWRPCW